MQEGYKNNPSIYHDIWTDTDYVWGQSTSIEIEGVNYEVTYNQQNNQFHILEVKETYNKWFTEEGYTREEATPFFNDEDALYSCCESILQELFENGEI
jgi:hypothetical protein